MEEVFALLNNVSLTMANLSWSQQYYQSSEKTSVSFIERIQLPVPKLLPRRTSCS